MTKISSGKYITGHRRLIIRTCNIFKGRKTKGMKDIGIIIIESIKLKNYDKARVIVYIPKK